MRQFVIGDIHGCSTALRRLDEDLRFGEDDLVITLGDYVDRGPDSRGVVEHLLALRSRCHLITLRGNHEVMMLRAREGGEALEEWIGTGGDRTLESYQVKSPDGIPPEHWRFMEETLPCYEGERDFFVHANAYPDFSLSEQPEFMLYWEKFHDPAPHQSRKRMICGHTPQKSGLPRDVGHAVCIDTWAHGGGWLTCLEFRIGRFWQANQKGQIRIDDLEELASE